MFIPSWVLISLFFIFLYKMINPKKCPVCHEKELDELDDNTGKSLREILEMPEKDYN